MYSKSKIQIEIYLYKLVYYNIYLGNKCVFLSITKNIVLLHRAPMLSLECINVKNQLF